MSDQPLTKLPPDLPRPEDDRAADGLEGRAVPAITLESTTGDEIDLASAAESTLASGALTSWIDSGGRQC